MKTAITCLIVALFWNIAATQQVSKYLSVSVHDPAWLQLTYPEAMTQMRFDGTNYVSATPERTVIFSTRRPSIREIKPGVWQITFPPQ